MFSKRIHSGLEVIKLEFSLKLKIKRNDWLLAGTYPQAALSLRFILSLRLNSSFITSRPGSAGQLTWPSKHPQTFLSLGVFLAEEARVCGGGLLHGFHTELNNSNYQINANVLQQAIMFYLYTKEPIVSA